MAKYDVESRIEKLVTAIGGLRANDRVPVRELADRLNYDLNQLLADLRPLQLMGAPQVDPTVLLDVVVEGDGDEAVLCVNSDPLMLSRPIRLTGPQSTATIMALLLSGYDYHSDLVQKIISSCASDWNETLFDRLVAVTSSPHEASVFETVSLACEKEYGLEMEYTTRDGETSTRVIEPLTIFHDGDLWYVFGWCHERGAGRRFRIEAISAPKLRRDIIVDRSLEQVAAESGLGVEELALAIAPSEAISATIRFPNPKDYRPLEWPDSLIARTLTNGARDVSVPMVNPRWLARKVAGYGGRAVAISPIELTDAVRAAVNELRTSLDLGEQSGC